MKNKPGPKTRNGSAGPQIPASGTVSHSQLCETARSPEDAALLNRCAGVILAGGQSRRFGSNKALALYQGRPLISHAAAILADLFPETLLVTNTPEIYEFLGWPMTGDLVPGAGPLAGIHAALSTIKEERAFVLACDMPLVEAAAISRLAAIEGDWDVILPCPATGREPLHAIYHRRLGPAIETALAAGTRKLGEFLAGVRVREVGEAELQSLAPDLASFRNINYQHDLAELRETGLPPDPAHDAAAAAPLLNLRQAQTAILAHIQPTAAELLPLHEALGRVPTEAVRARLAVPSFCQSCRDGYALRAGDTVASGEQARRFAVQGEIAAGRPASPRLIPGRAFRIMTGGMIPAGADMVVPFEEIEEEDAGIVVSRPGRKGSHIRPVGADLRRNQVIAEAGRPIAPDHLPLLATAGVAAVAVHARPRIGLLCTGSELLDEHPGEPAPGMLISGNRALLAGLVRQGGGEPVDLGMVADDRRQIAAIIEQQHAANLTAIISTGGMGPGKYDLVVGALKQLGARILYHALAVRPGKATLAATLGDTMFFGLPGPPPAVHILFYALILPALRQAQGLRHPRLPVARAVLEHPLAVRQRGVQHLKGGVVGWPDGRLTVRAPRPREAINALILVPAHRKSFPAGTPITVHLLKGTLLIC